MPGWVKRGAVDPTFSTDTCNVCDPRVCHQSKACLGAVLRGFSLQAPKVPCDRVRLALVLVSTAATLLRPLFRGAGMGCQQQGTSFLETSWLPQQSPGNFQLFLGLSFHRGPLQGSPQLETSLVHTHVTSKTLVTPVNWHRDPTSSGLQNLWGRAEEHEGFLCDPVTHQLHLGFPPVMDALEVLMNTPCHPLSCVQHQGMASASGELFVEHSRGFSEWNSQTCTCAFSFFFLFLSLTSPPYFPFPFSLYPFPFLFTFPLPSLSSPFPFPPFFFPSFSTFLFPFPFPFSFPFPLPFLFLFPTFPFSFPFPLCFLLSLSFPLQSEQGLQLAEPLLWFLVFVFVFFLL